jgi:hypothetical protein
MSGRRSNDGNGPFTLIDTRGGNRTFAAGTNQIGQLEECRRSERRFSFFDVQTQRRSARSPLGTVFCNAANACFAGSLPKIIVFKMTVIPACDTTIE